MAEEWRIIAEFPEYAVSDLGRVKRVVDGWRKPAGYILKQNTIHGYQYVGLSRPGKVFSRRVNRLVCIAFHGDPPTPEHHAAHKNGRRPDNRADNLRWATPSSNMCDKVEHGTTPYGEKNGSRLHPDRLARGLRNGKYTRPESTPRGESHGKSKLTAEQARSIRDDTRSQRVIAAHYGISRGAVVSIKNRLTWRHIP